MEHLDTTQFKSKGLTYVIVSVLANVALGLACGFCYYLATQATTQEDLDSKVKAMKICFTIAIVLLCLFAVYFVIWLGFASTIVSNILG